MKTSKHLILTLLFVTSIFSFAFCANLPPTSNAGRDTTIIAGSLYSTLKGTATDDSLDIYSLNYAWKQLSGPVPGAVIAAPASRNSRVTFSEAGIYSFELAVNDGKFTTKDTVVITVTKDVPLKFLTPKPGDVIAQGSTFTFTWEWSPVSDGVFIHLSVDRGKNWISLTPQPIAKGLKSWDWVVPDTIPVGTKCKFYITDYFSHLYRADVDSVTIGAKVAISNFPRNFAIQPKGTSFSVFSVNGRSISNNGISFKNEKAPLIYLSKNNTKMVQSNKKISLK